MSNLYCMEDYLDEIKLKLTGDLLESELDDDTIAKIVKSALRELNRYITDTSLITIPFKECIDLSDPKDTKGQEIEVNSISMVYRAKGMGNSSSSEGGSSESFDPMEVARWQMLSGMGNLMNFQDAVYNYSAWSTVQQLQNTTSTDMAFIFDKHTHKLYINSSNGRPDYVTIEYIPVFTEVEQICSEYWQDMLVRLSIALTKCTLGRIRTRYVIANSPVQQDGERILQEGNEELSYLREMLLQNSELCYPVD